MNNLTQHKINQAKQKLRDFNRLHPPRPIDQTAIAQALSFPDTPYFITTNLYWDCECPANYIHPAAMNMCEDCGAFRDESPDSSLTELKDMSFHIDLEDLAVVASMDEHNISSRNP